MINHIYIYICLYTHILGMDIWECEVFKAKENGSVDLLSQREVKACNPGD